MTIELASPSMRHEMTTRQRQRVRELRSTMDVSGLSHTAKRVLVVLQLYWRFDFGNSWRSFQALSEEVNRPLEETRRAVYELRDAGAVEYSTMTDYELRPAGSGYFLTYAWDV